MSAEIFACWKPARPFRPEQVERARELIGACPAVRGEVTGLHVISVHLHPTPEAVALLAKLVEGLE